MNLNRWILLGLLVVMLLLGASACGGDDDDTGEVPTLAASITPPPTRTPFAQPSPGTPTQALAMPPTATQLVLLSTATFTPFPTVQPAAATPYPYNVQITYPVDGSQIAGYVPIYGSASHPRFVQYALEWGPDPNPNNLWYPFTAQPQMGVVLNGTLGAWNTTSVNDGNYQIRVHVWLNDGTDATDLVTGIRVSNTKPTAVPTATATLRPNLVPVINPIPSQQVTAGQTIRIPVTASDPNNDPFNLLVASSNTAIANAQVSAAREISVTGATAGQVTITVTANDSYGGITSTAFIVTVQGQNRAPVIELVAPSEELKIGGTLDVPVNTTDPDGDSLAVVVESDQGGVATAVMVNSTLLRLTGVGAGTATITITASDSRGASIQRSFPITVRDANAPPTIDPIPQQTITAGLLADVTYRALDPDGDSIIASVTSDNQAVVLAEILTQGTIRLTGLSAGDANVLLGVSDSINPEVILSFPVKVTAIEPTATATNGQPTIQPVEPQAVDVGKSTLVTIAATDPDSDPLTLNVISDQPTVAGVSVMGMDVTITGLAEGPATITVEASDGRGGIATAAIPVTVGPGNVAPVFEPPLTDQTLKAGEMITVPISILDSDGDPVVLTALPRMTTVVSAQVVNNNSVELQALDVGTDVIDLTADDGQGGVTMGSFIVTVEPAAPTFDLMSYPVLPDISPSMAQTLALVYQGGVANYNIQANAFSKVGDDPMESSNFLAPFATPGSYDLGPNGDLQGLIDAYAPTTVRADPATNSLNVDSVAAGPGYGIDMLSAAAPAAPPCDTLGGTNLSCEYQATRPSIALISFSAPNVIFLPSEQFRSELQALVMNSMSMGVIPVLATIPADGQNTAEQLAEYNRAVVEIATQTGVPLWNLARAMQEYQVSDPYSAAPEGPGNLTTLTYGYNVRNLTALQTLQRVRQAVGIQ